MKKVLLAAIAAASLTVVGCSSSPGVAAPMSGIPLGCYGVGITTVFHTGMQTMNNSYEYAAAACTGPPTLPYQTWVSAATAGDALIECQALIPSTTSAVLLSLTPVVADVYQCV
jgi:hypothetical protein